MPSGAVNAICLYWFSGRWSSTCGSSRALSENGGTLDQLELGVGANGRNRFALRHAVGQRLVKGRARLARRVQCLAYW